MNNRNLESAFADTENLEMTTEVEQELNKIYKEKEGIDMLNNKSKLGDTFTENINLYEIISNCLIGEIRKFKINFLKYVLYILLSYEDLIKFANDKVKFLEKKGEYFEDDFYKIEAYFSKEGFIFDTNFIIERIDTIENLLSSNEYSWNISNIKLSKINFSQIAETIEDMSEFISFATDAGSSFQKNANDYFISIHKLLVEIKSIESLVYSYDENED